MIIRIELFDHRNRVHGVKNSIGKKVDMKREVKELLHLMNTQRVELETGEVDD